MVVAGGAVGAERHRNALGAHLDDRREAGAELQIRSRTMQHLDTPLGHQRLLIVVDPHAVSEAELRRGQAGVGEIVDVLAAGARLDQRDLVAILRRVRVDDELMLDREPRDGFEQLARARDRESRRERGAQAAIGPAVPALGDRHAFVDRSRGLFHQSRRHRGIRVHHALADDRAQPHRLERLEDGIGIVHGLHRQHRGRARSQQLGCGLLRGCGQRRRRVRGLHRPDARLQPVEQGEIIGVAAEQCLAKMNVRLDEARQEIRSATVNYLLRRLRRHGRSTRSGRREPPHRLRSRRRRRSW